MAAVHAACGDVGHSGGLSVCEGCVWAVRRAGLMRSASREWLFAINVRVGAGALERHVTRKGVNYTEA